MIEPVELTARQAAASLGVRLGTLYTLLWDGAISGRKDERNEWRIDRESIEVYRAQRSARRERIRRSQSRKRRKVIDVEGVAVRAATGEATGRAL